MASQVNTITDGATYRKKMTDPTTKQTKKPKTYVYESSQPPTMSGGGGTTGQGSFVPKRCTTPQELQALNNITKIQQWASEHALAPSVRDFVNLGAEDDESLQANARSSRCRYALRPRILRNVSRVDTSTTILQGRITLQFPLGVSPFAGCRAIHPDGETAIAQQAAAAGIVYTIPNWSSTPVSELVQTTPGEETQNFFFQVYPHKPTHSDEGMDRHHMTALLQYLASLPTTNNNNKIQAIAVTCDTVNNGNRDETYKNPHWLQALQDEVGGFPAPNCLPKDGVLPYVAAEGHSSSMTWDDIRWMKSECDKHQMALVIKGVMTAEDTRAAAQIGVDAVMISNHGGRQLDGTLGTMEVLTECVAAIPHDSEMEVWIDGGIRRGKDMAKCLALGARCVFVGRPILWGLGVAGADGVQRVLEIYREEFQTVLQLLGCASVPALTEEYVEDRQRQSTTSKKRQKERIIDPSWFVWTTTTMVAVVAFALGRLSR